VVLLIVVVVVVVVLFWPCAGPGGGVQPAAIAKIASKIQKRFTSLSFQ
jgi:hypothetical protein